MYVKEMHIEVEQATQKIAANKTRKFLDEELDWLLNKGMERFVQSRVSPKKDGSGGYEVRSFEADAIRPLMRTGVELPAFVADSRRYFVNLPGDYSYLISDESVIKVAKAGQKATRYNFNLYYLTIPITKSPLANGPYYQDVSLSLNGGVEFDIQQYAQARNANYPGYTDIDEVFEISKVILNTLSDKGWRVYWEHMGDLYLPRTLIIPTGQLTTTGSVTIDGRTVAGTQGAYTLQTDDIYNQPTRDESNRLTASNLIPDLREAAFYQTQPESPISELAGYKLYTYANTSFIVTLSRISYVRKARRISLILGQDCELAPEYHNLVCDLTVEYIKAMIADPNWEVKMKDNMARTPI